jgi:hypothetical protein
MGKVIKPGNAKKTFGSEGKLRNKELNSIRLANGEEIATDNFEEINSQVIKAEVNVITLRNLVERYQILYRSICAPEEFKDTD